MKPYSLFFTLLLLSDWNVAHAGESCQALELTDLKSSIWLAAKDIVRPGQYCLTQDIHMPRRHAEVFAIGERSSPYNGILEIQASHVDIDLRGFTMDADAWGLSGIAPSYSENTQKNITIHNGRIRSRTRSGILLDKPKGSLLSDFKPKYKTPGYAEDEFEKMLKSLPASASAYENTGHRIENLKIEAVLRGYEGCNICEAIGMKGASNIIRNSTIEITDGHAAIYLFGPNQLIENNIIIFKGKAAVESAAAIKLHQADGTIIRNNDIIIESMGDEAPKAAISLIDSKDVVIENNRIYGINTLVKDWDEKSSSIEKNNEFRSMFRRPLTIGEPGVH
ncbi:right-handed parallel beta-helix repeat-containing protein [Undibacterium sp. SXout11W]|uniref:right-handed parallel beta-helix repeat-containing protein n=1 Tax=Undibacterium sp. SXout11W TaxID=3413050 RepID=UPI003BF33FC5